MIDSPIGNLAASGPRFDVAVRPAGDEFPTSQLLTAAECVSIAA